MVPLSSLRRFFSHPAGGFQLPPHLALGLLLLPLFAGCGALNAYRTEAVLLHSRHTIIENFAISEIDPREVDQLLFQVAEILEVRLDPAVPKPRIMVTSPDRISRFFGASSAAYSGHTRAAALYFPGANLILIPYFDRTILGHELAHYLTDHYLKKVPRSQWEDIAHSVEWKLMLARVPPTSPHASGEVTGPAGETPLDEPRAVAKTAAQ